MRKRLVELGIQPVSAAAGRLEAFVLGEMQKWGDLVRRVNISAE